MSRKVRRRMRERQEHTIIHDLLERLGQGSPLGLARALHVGRATVNRWLKAGRIPPETPWEIVKRVERLSGVSEHVLTSRFVRDGQANDGKSGEGGSRT